MLRSDDGQPEREMIVHVLEMILYFYVLQAICVFKLIFHTTRGIL